MKLITVLFFYVLLYVGVSAKAQFVNSACERLNGLLSQLNQLESQIENAKSNARHTCNAYGRPSQECDAARSVRDGLISDKTQVQNAVNSETDNCNRELHQGN